MFSRPRSRDKGGNFSEKFRARANNFDPFLSSRRMYTFRWKIFDDFPAFFIYARFSSNLISNHAQTIHRRATGEYWRERSAAIQLEIQISLKFHSVRSKKNSSPNTRRVLGCSIFQKIIRARTREFLSPLSLPFREGSVA